MTVGVVCWTLTCPADYVLFGEERSGSVRLAERIEHIDKRYLPMLNGVITQLLALNSDGEKGEE